jgi:hypothetical protein
MLPNMQQIVNGTPKEDFSSLVRIVNTLEYVIDGADTVSPTLLMMVRQLRSQIPAEVTAGIEE